MNPDEEVEVILRLRGKRKWIDLLLSFFKELDLCARANVTELFGFEVKEDFDVKVNIYDDIKNGKGYTRKQTMEKEVEKIRYFGV